MVLRYKSRQWSFKWWHLLSNKPTLAMPNPHFIPQDCLCWGHKLCLIICFKQFIQIRMYWAQTSSYLYQSSNSRFSLFLSRILKCIKTIHCNDFMWRMACILNILLGKRVTSELPIGFITVLSIRDLVMHVPIMWKICCKYVWWICLWLITADYAEFHKFLSNGSFQTCQCTSTVYGPKGQ